MVLLKALLAQLCDIDVEPELLMLNSPLSGYVVLVDVLLRVPLLDVDVKESL